MLAAMHLSTCSNFVQVRRMNGGVECTTHEKQNVRLQSCFCGSLQTSCGRAVTVFRV